MTLSMRFELLAETNPVPKGGYGHLKNDAIAPSTRESWFQGVGRKNQCVVTVR
jgi:hypothetical protein